MGAHKYITDPYTSFALDIHREFPIPVPMHMEVLRDDIELYVGKDDLLYIAPLVAAAPLLAKVPAIAKIADTVKNVLGKIGIGGVTQKRFIARTEEMFNAFEKAGYNNGWNGENLSYKDYRIGKTHVEDKKSKGNYAAEFERLRQYIIRRLNIYNPGLGDAYAYYFPEFKMANLGNIHDAPMTALKDILKAYPPGTYDPGEVVMPQATAKAPAGPAIPGYQSANLKLNAAQLAVGGGTAGGADAPATDEEKKKLEAKTQQIVTYVTLGMAVVILTIAIIVKLKQKA